ncbi:Prostaglandin F synthase [Paramuricea clavata]|uniref:Prostaglandin F synthase n=1 Tax=Paramuricea clavata TaxID=317549 RepID=A0A6S7IM00_PARCT|nr:Prostaglandin F synthase [Paramuricea clavata]
MAKECIDDLTLKFKYPLNDGNFIPVLGLGVYQCSKDDVEGTSRSVSIALKQGYPMIDTAEMYKNEEEVGQGIKKSNLRREHVYFVTKLWEQNGYEYCLKAFDASLKRLDMDYVDLYLMHTPIGDHLLETYDAFLALKEKGLAKSIGVSNFNIAMLEGLRKAGKPTPAVNQIEIHPYMRRDELVQYCRDHGIHVTAFSPLTKGKRLKEPDMVTMAASYKKTVAQLFIRWCIQSGFSTIPKSSNEKRIIENSQVFDWSISDEDMKILNSKPQATCINETATIFNIHDMKPSWTSS